MGTFKRSGGKQWHLPSMLRTRAIPVAWLSSGLCPDRPKGWIPIVLIIIFYFLTAIFLNYLYLSSIVSKVLNTLLHCFVARPTSYSVGTSWFFLSGDAERVEAYHLPSINVEVSGTWIYISARAMHLHQMGVTCIGIWLSLGSEVLIV